MNKALTREPRLRIALLGYRSHPYVGGQGIYLHYLSKALYELGHEIVVFSGPPYPQLVDGVELVKVPSLDLYACEHPWRALRWHNLASFTDLYEWFSKLSGGFAEPRTFGRRLLEFHREELKGFDIIHDNQSLCPALTTLRKSGSRVTATIHHPIHRDRQLAVQSTGNWGRSLLVHRWYSFIRMQEKVAGELESIITVSQCSKNDIVEHFPIAPEKIRVIPNGIDTQIFKPDKSLKRHKGRLLTTASSDQAIKGLHILLEAFARIEREEADVELLIIGSLKKHSLAEKCLNKLDKTTRGKIRFISDLSTAELVEQYNAANLAICPSLYEGFGIPALEAMACGLPLVSSNGGALPEVVGDAGLLVEAGNSEALARNCLRLLRDKTLQDSLSKKAIARVQANYCWQRVARAYLEFYQCQQAHYAEL